MLGSPGPSPPRIRHQDDHTCERSRPALTPNEGVVSKISTIAKPESQGVRQQPVEHDKRWYRHFGPASWTWEILATLGSLFCQGAIVAILASMQNQPLSRWTATVSINAFVATLTTAAKSMMLFAVAGCLGQLKWIYFQSRPRQLYHLELFDELGKGPLGAIQTLFRVRWAAAYLGVVIVLLALAIDPFAQQVVSFQSQDDLVNDPAVSFRISHNYTASAHWNGFGALVGKPMYWLMESDVVDEFDCRGGRLHARCCFERPLRCKAVTGV